jgi:hypothetical protein|tara:strand:+ start:2177 stop:3052 length:876 start_codon:yes stop_codon:yes gene_type:complete
MNKVQIADEIKKVSIDKVKKEWVKIQSMNIHELSDLNGRNRLGCDLLDYYFFKNRLDTIGNKGIHFFDFLRDIEKYKAKKYIQTLLTFCEKNNRYKDSDIRKYYYCYGLCFGRINGFKITNALQIYYKFNPTSIMDPFCGFGGRMTAAMIANIHYIGIDLNPDLKNGYDALRNDFSEKHESDVQILFEDSVNVDYSQYVYDMVFTSPPYENIEVYKNSEKKTSIEWETFYETIFHKLWKHLQNGGVYAININESIYTKILLKLFGDAHEKILLKKSSKNNYKEYIYIWKKV